MIRGKSENLIKLTLRVSEDVKLSGCKEKEKHLHNGVIRVS